MEGEGETYDALEIEFQANVCAQNSHGDCRNQPGSRVAVAMLQRLSWWTDIAAVDKEKKRCR